MNRVVITGAGCISALGADLAATWAGMREGRSGIATLEGLPLERLRISIGAQVPVPSLRDVHISGRPRSRASNVDGVCASKAVAS